MVAVTKLSVALDSDVATSAKEAAARAGLSLSAWLNKLAEHELRVQEGLQAVAEWEAENGPLTSEERLRGRDFVREVKKRHAGRSRPC